MIETGIGHFWITFENGYTLSIFNGYGSYSENRFNKNLQKSIFYEQKAFATVKSKDCEIAIIYEGELVTDNYLNFGDSIKGNVSFNELLKIFDLVRNLK